MKIVVRVDASVAMGMGHTMRCLTLADELRQNYAATVFFICRAHQGHLAETIRSRGYGVHLLPKPVVGFQPAQDDVNHANWLNVHWTRDAEETIEVVRHLKPDWLIIDHYAIDARWHKLLRSHVKYILAIDDLADRQLDCDILLDQTYGRQENDYQGLVTRNCRLLLGSSFALLKPEFLKLRPQAINKRKSFSGIKRILVNFGGTDPQNLTSEIIESLAQIDWVTAPSIDLVMGSQSPYIDEIDKKIKDHPLKISIAVDVSDMAERILAADLAIGAAGSTTWERCCLGLPTILIECAENQREICERLSKRGVVSLIGNASSISQKRITKAIEQIVRSKKLWQQMSSKSFMVTNGLGTKRTAIELDLPKSREGLSIRLRPVTLNDMELLYKWQCNPATRRYAHNPEIPKIDEHNKWLKQQICKADAVTELILHGNEPAGVIRLDPEYDVNQLSYIVSIYIDPDKYNLGIAKAALNIISRFLPFVELKAEVHTENQLSHSLFNSVGFYKHNENLYIKHPDVEV